MIHKVEINLFKFFNDVSLFFLTFFSNIYEIANFANKIIELSDHEYKDMRLSFYLVPILVVYDA